MKIGILSFAHMHAYSYAACIRRLAGVKLAGLADRNRARGSRLARSYRTKYFPDYRDLLATDVNAVIITSENALHKEMALAAAQAGKHILCEKPIATNRADALAMIAASAEHGVKFQMAFPCRFATPIRRAKELIESAALGQVYAINGTNHGKMPGGWFTDKRRAGGGAVMDHTVHVVDLQRWMLNAEVSKIYAEIDTRFHDIGVEDCGVLSMEFDNGVFATLDPSWSRPKTFPFWGDVTMQIVGEKGTLFVDAFKQVVAVYTDSKQGHYFSHWGDNMDMEMVKHFLTCIRENRPPSPDGTDGLRALEVALAAYRSAKKRAVVSLQELWPQTGMETKS